jgi:hypothetical protein
MGIGTAMRSQDLTYTLTRDVEATGNLIQPPDLPAQHDHLGRAQPRFRDAGVVGPPRSAHRPRQSQSIRCSPGVSRRHAPDAGSHTSTSTSKMLSIRVNTAIVARASASLARTAPLAISMTEKRRDDPRTIGSCRGGSRTYDAALIRICDADPAVKRTPCHPAWRG